MPDLVFITSDGVTVALGESVYRNKIFPKHPEVAVADIQATLTSPHRICDHFTEVDSRVMTAYLEIRPYRGTQRWP